MRESIGADTPTIDYEAGMLVERLEALKAAGAAGDELLRAAVETVAAASPRYDWVGAYMLEGDTLVLSHFVGAPTEHTRIEIGDGVCGTAIAENRDINVPDVRELDNYIACSLDTRSELVVLIRDAGGATVGQLDLDSDTPGAFTEADEKSLRKIADWLGVHLDRNR